MTLKIKLFCILDGDSSSFSVKVDPDDSIDELKVAIKEKKKPRFDDIASDELVLFHVAVPDEGKHVNLSNVEAPTPLIIGSAEISEVFGSTPAKKTIHVIVRRPSAGKRCPELFHYTDDYDDDASN
ncbi:hypothetical protein BGZ76_003498 [Entomortierella beljakovae]|nr:hypothetical protein BGZ76_003498 [Entomortierella beljakovae]